MLHNILLCYLGSCCICLHISLLFADIPQEVLSRSSRSVITCHRHLSRRSCCLTGLSSLLSSLLSSAGQTRKMPQASQVCLCKVVKPLHTLHYAALSPAKHLSSSQSPVGEKRVTGCPIYLQDGDSVLP